MFIFQGLKDHFHLYGTKLKGLRVTSDVQGKNLRQISLKPKYCIILLSDVLKKNCFTNTQNLRPDGALKINCANWFYFVILFTNHCKYLEKMKSIFQTDILMKNLKRKNTNLTEKMLNSTMALLISFFPFR